MQDAPLTFSESWYRVANQRICLHPAVQARRQNYRGQRWWVLENPFNNQYFRLRPAAYEFVARLRPDRTVEEVWQECLTLFPDEAPGQESVIQLLSQLYQANLLQYNLAEDSAQLFRRYERTRQRERKFRFLNIMFMRFPLLDPDAFLVKTLPVVGKAISWAGALIWLGVVGGALKIVLDNLPLLKVQSESVLAPSNLPLLYVGLVFVKTLHEFGHAYFCRHFGGEVHVMGVMLMIFTPVPYMDATSSWGFRSRWQRMLVGGAGMIVELFVAALATFVWARTGQGVVHSLAYNIIFVASVSTVIFNINPLLRYDGYYMLSDFLDIPNLHQRATEQLRYYSERFLFGIQKLIPPAHTTNEGIWLSIFGVLSSIYRVIVFGGILLVVADRFLLLGLLMAAVCLISWIAVPISRLFIYLSSSPRLARNRPRAVAVTLGLAGVALLFFQFVPFPHHFRAPGVVKSREWADVLTESAGRVEKIAAPPGTRVTRGQPLIEMSNPELDLELAAALAAQEEMDARLRHALKEQIANLQPLTLRMESIRLRVQRLQKDKAALTVRARQDGLWISPHSEEFAGRWIHRGTALGLLLDPSSFQFQATIRQEDGDRIFAGKLPGGEVRLKGQSQFPIRVGTMMVIPGEQRSLPSAALGWASGGDIPVAPDDPEGRRAVEPFFELRAELLPKTDAALLHGRAGQMRFDLPSEPLLPRAVKRLRQLLQKRYQL